MPINIYAIASKFKKMKTTISANSPNARQTPNAQTPSQMVGRASYNKGYGRLNMDQIVNAEPDVSINQMFNMNGMVRSTDDTGKNRSGGYLTFRIISAESPASSWIRKAIPPVRVTPAVVSETEGIINDMVDAAIKEDLGL
jgi:hypothetical protein